MFAMSLPSDNCDTLISSKFAVELRNVFVSCEEWPVADKLFGSIIVANLHWSTPQRFRGKFQQSDSIG